jgi:hypothetical protein
MIGMRVFQPRRREFSSLSRIKEEMKTRIPRKHQEIAGYSGGGGGVSKF